MENLARYITHAFFSQERMTYVPEGSKVIYQSKDGKDEEAIDPLGWFGAMCSHIPDKGEQMVRYYGSNGSSYHFFFYISRCCSTETIQNPSVEV